jgi:hypothetical protein
VKLMLYRSNLRGRRRLGLVSVPVGASLVYGSSVVPAISNIRRPVAIGPARVRPMPPIQVGPAMPYDPVYSGPGSQWGANPPGGVWGSRSVYGSSSSYGPNPNNPSSQNNLAMLTQQYYSNPASLTALQWQQLQAAGVIPGTVPYSNAGLVNPSASLSMPSSAGAIDPATGLPYAQELAAQQAALTTPAASSVIGTDPTTGSTTIFGVDWYWLVAAVGLVYVFSGKRGR